MDQPEQRQDHHKSPFVSSLSLIAASLLLIFIAATSCLDLSSMQGAHLLPLPPLQTPTAFAMTAFVFVSVAISTMVWTAKGRLQPFVEAFSLASIVTACSFMLTLYHARVKSALYPNPQRQFDIGEVFVLGLLAHIGLFLVILLPAIFLSYLSRNLSEH